MAAVLDPSRPSAAPAAEEPPVTAVVGFNLDPARYAHRSWLPQPLRARGTAAHASASAWLLREHALEADVEWAPRAPMERVFLGAQPWFASLALELGAARRREALALAIDGTVQRRLRALPGVDAEGLRFALLHAPRAATPLSSLDDLLRSPARASHRLQREGASLLLALLDTGSSAVARRARLRLPRGLRAAALEPAQRSAWAGYLFNRLIPARFTPWLWLS